MITKKTYKNIRSLKDKKIRYAQKKFTVEGVRLLQTILDENVPIECAVYTKEFYSKHLEFIKQINDKILFEVSEKEMKDLSNAITPSGILAITSFPLYSNLDLSKNLIYLDQISDPGNMGTILRTASWFGVDQVALSNNCIDPFNPKVIAAAMGSHFLLKFVGKEKIENLDEHLWIGASLNGKKLPKLKEFKRKWVLAMGSEAHGISEKTMERLDKIYTIPRLGKGESLNVAVAMGIFLDKLVS